ncbi:MAG: methyltransferase [Chitinophagales bacterium]|jgi:tRNA1Val (adenine37-N6)-methyltransferase|nr:methyltransferase [Chitinophagales bacterium]
MANTYFSFKQFTIHQEQCAMKVSTDACLFGAYIASAWEGQTVLPERVLDIGTGTGLLTLMLAQKNPSAIYTAIELDVQAARQAEGNFLNSPWSQQISILNENVLTWQQDSVATFDLIVCNPPFFAQHLLSEEQARLMARHDEFLTLEHLKDIAQKHLAEEGVFGVLLPHSRKEECLRLFETNFHLAFLLESSDNAQKPLNRVILGFSKTKCIPSITSQQLVLHESNGSRSAAWQALIQDYYLR